jgi:predicted nucleotidyltransferase/predicted transcriptional regulator
MRNRDIDVITTIIENQEKSININQIAKKLKMDYKNTYNIVKKLNKKNVINLIRESNFYNVILNNNINPLLFQAEYYRREKLLENKDLKILYNKLNNITLPFIALIFGSYARNMNNKSSDIDLMLIYDNDLNNSINHTISLLPLDIHLIEFTYDEFIKLFNTKEFNVVHTAVENHIILIGIEDYYRVVSNVRS